MLSFFLFFLSRQLVHASSFAYACFLAAAAIFRHAHMHHVRIVETRKINSCVRHRVEFGIHIDTRVRQDAHEDQRLHRLKR